MNSQSKKKFVNAIWVTGLYKTSEIIGRTYRHNGQNWIILITDTGRSLIVPFHSVNNLQKITILKEKSPAITVSFQNKKILSVMEMEIMSTLSMVNK